MSEYYLIAQLPSLDGISDSAPLPITEERFFALCHQFLGKTAQRRLQQLTLLPSVSPEKTGSALIDAWNLRERDLRLALGQVRAERLHKEFSAQPNHLPAELLQAARTAVEMKNPLEAEKFLNRHRLNFLENLRPADPFAEAFLFYYGLKLKLLQRIRQFDTALGAAAYRRIYDSILSHDRQEAVS